MADDTDAQRPPAPAHAAEPELFHAIADPGSATARRLVVELGLESRVRLRNLFYPEVAADLKLHGGAATPALWDGQHLIEGADAVAAALHRLASQPA